MNGTTNETQGKTRDELVERAERMLVESAGLLKLAAGRANPELQREAQGLAADMARLTGLLEQP